MSKLGVFFTLLLSVLLIVNYASPVVKASSIQITRILVLGEIISEMIDCLIAEPDQYQLIDWNENKPPISFN